MEASYPIRAVSKITGLSIDTLRAWERRYGAVAPQRGQRGRQYGPEQIQRLTLLRDLVRRGHAIGLVATLPDEQLRALLEAPAPARGPAAPSADLLAALLAAISRFDHLSASEELNRLAATLPPREFVHRIVLPLMREVGERWHSGELTVAQEHLASGILRNLFGSLLRVYPPRPNAPTVLLATPAGERHEFGVLAAAMLAAIHGLNPLYLGSDLPASELADAIQRSAASVAVLGVSTFTDQVDRELRLLADALPGARELWIGGAPEGTALPSGFLPLSSMEDFEDRCRRLSPRLN